MFYALFLKNCNTVEFYILSAISILILTTIHEFTKALISYKLGDKSVKESGKLSLNPLVHFEPIGFLLFLFKGYGWGKPTETSALYYKNRKRDTLLVYITPILINLLLCPIFFLLVHLSMPLVLRNFLYISSVNTVALAIFNLIPIYPLCGEKILLCLLPPDNAFNYSQKAKSFQILVIILLLSNILKFALDSLLNSLLFKLYFLILNLF